MAEWFASCGDSSPHISVKSTTCHGLHNVNRGLQKHLQPLWYVSQQKRLRRDGKLHDIPQSKELWGEKSNPQDKDWFTIILTKHIDASFAPTLPVINVKFIPWHQSLLINSPRTSATKRAIPSCVQPRGTWRQKTPIFKKIWGETLTRHQTAMLKKRIIKKCG